MQKAKKITALALALNSLLAGYFLQPALCADAARTIQLLKTMTTQYNAGQYVQAGHTGQQVLAIDANNLTAHYMMGNIFLQAQELDSAGDEYEWCIAHGAGTAIAKNAQNALDVMEGKVRPQTAARTALPITRLAGQAAAVSQLRLVQQPPPLPTQFSNPYNMQDSAQELPQVNPQTYAPVGPVGSVNAMPNSNSVLSRFTSVNPRGNAAKIADLLQTMTSQYNAGQYVQAGRTGQQVLALDANNLSAHYMMGNVFLQAQVLDSAGNEYDWCVANGAGTAIAVNAQRALDVMEGKVTPSAAARTALPVINLARKAAPVPQMAQTPARRMPAFTAFDPYANVLVASQEERMVQQRFSAMRAASGKVESNTEKLQDQMLLDRVRVDVKQEILDGLIKKENDQALKKVYDLNHYTLNGQTLATSVRYPWEEENIWKATNEKIKALQATFEQEKIKLTEDYQTCFTSVSSPPRSK